MAVVKKVERKSKAISKTDPFQTGGERSSSYPKVSDLEGGIDVNWGVRGSKRRSRPRKRGKKSKRKEVLFPQAIELLICRERRTRVAL